MCLPHVPPDPPVSTLPPPPRMKHFADRIREIRQREIWKISHDDRARNGVLTQSWTKSLSISHHRGGCRDAIRLATWERAAPWRPLITRVCFHGLLSVLCMCLWVVRLHVCAPPPAPNTPRSFLWIPDVMATGWQRPRAHAVVVTDEVNMRRCAAACQHTSRCPLTPRKQPNSPGGNELLMHSCFPEKMPDSEVTGKRRAKAALAFFLHRRGVKLWGGRWHKSPQRERRHK